MADLSLDCPECGAPNSVPMTGDSTTFTCTACGAESPIEDVATGATEVAEDQLVGEVISDCRIVAKVGEGGFGTVYKAVDQSLQRVVAVKVMLPSLSSNLEFVQKFLREAVTAANLNHSNIVAMHKAGRDERRGIHFLVMEFVEGQTLADVVEKKGVLTVDELLPIALQCCDALATAHESNIVHRDIKPENLMIDTRGSVKITDFGLAKSLSSDAKTTKVMGTPHYMSPEQFEGKPVDGRSDIYSLGVTFYYLLSRARPYEGENTVQIVYSILTQDPKPLPDVAKDVPGPLWSVIQKMIAKKAEDRYQTLRETAEDLKKLQQRSSADRSQCAECGAKNPKGRKFCRGCGAALLVKCPACGQDAGARATRCEACGADIERLLTVRKALLSGRRFKEMGDLRRAVESFRQALDIDSTNAEASAELGEVSATLGELERVKSEAEDLLQTGDMEEALRRVEDVLRKHPQAVEAREHRDRLRRQVAAHRVNELVEEAETAATAGDVRRALERLDAALRVDPDRADVRARRDELARRIAQVTESRQRAVEALSAGRYEDAFALASEVLQLAPGDAAMEEVRRKSRASVESVDSLVAQGRKKLGENEWAEALSKFEAALSLRPGEAALLALVEDTRRRITEHRERLSACRRHMADGRFAEATAELERVLAAMPNDAEARSLAEACRKAAEESARVTDAARALEDARKLEKAGNLAGAAERLKKAVDLDSANDEARALLREIETRIRHERDLRELANELLSDGRYGEAVEALERLREANPSKGAAIQREVAEARERERQVTASVRRAEEALAAREFRRSAEAAAAALGIAPRHPRATAVKKDADKAVAAIDRFLAEADRLILSEMFDEALEVLDKARERGAVREEYEPRRVACDQGRMAILKTDATRSLVTRDYEAAIAAYEQVLETAADDPDALRGKRSAERRLRILTTEPMSLRLGAAAVVLLLLGLVQMTAVSSTATAATKAEEVANLERKTALEVKVVETGQLEPDYAPAFAAERRGDFAAAAAAFEQQMRVEDGKFANDAELRRGRDFARALESAEKLTDPKERLDALGAAAALRGDRPDVRDARDKLLAERSQAAIDAWFRQVAALERDRPGDALRLIGEIERHPVARLSPALEKVRGRGDYLEAMDAGNTELLAPAPRFVVAARAFQGAAELMSGDAERRAVAEQRLATTRDQWMKTLRAEARAAEAARDDAAYFAVIGRLVEFGRTLGIEREAVLAEFRR